jgi:hypothetical protein
MGIKPTPRVRFKGTWDEEDKTKSNADRRRGKKLLESDKTKSNADRRRARRRGKKLLESGKTISNADRRRAEEFFGDRWAPIRQSGGTISDADFLNRHDGGMAKKTRTF